MANFKEIFQGAILRSFKSGHLKEYKSGDFRES